MKSCIFAAEKLDKDKNPLIVTAAIEPRAEAACRLCRGGAVKTEGQLSIVNCQFGDSMQEYISKQQQIFRSAAQIFPLISNFSLLTPAVADKVEEWQATEDSCSFKFKGFTVALRIDEKVDNKHVKITGDGGTLPMDFSFWIQLHQVSEGDTRIRLVLHAELNMMMRMMDGNKLQKGLDQAVETFASAFNRF